MFKNIWVFPNMVGFRPNHPIFIRFSIINHPFWGTTILGNHHIPSKTLEATLLGASNLRVRSFKAEKHVGWFWKMRWLLFWYTSGEIFLNSFKPWEIYKIQAEKCSGWLVLVFTIVSKDHGWCKIHFIQLGKKSLWKKGVEVFEKLNRLGEGGPRKKNGIHWGMP